MELGVPYQIINWSDLHEDDQSLVESAIDAMRFSHSPYSNFKVGAAVSDVNGKVTSGSNQENAAYPSGLCAERVALFNAKSQDVAELKAIVVVAESDTGEWADAFCCGNCRQVMLEYASIQPKPIRIMMRNADGDFVLLEDVKALLPFHFDAGRLK